MSGFEIRMATAADIPSIMEMKVRAIRQSAAGFYSKEQIEAWVGAATPERGAEIVVEATGYVAVVGDRVVGLTNLENDNMTVDQLYVDPDFGGRGVALAMLEQVEALARSRGSNKLTTTASLRSQPVFERAGFAEDYRFTKSFGGQEYDAAIMTKHLR